MRMFVVLLFLPTLLSAQVRQQGDSTMEALLNYSRPGNYHNLLGQLAGSWNFKDAKLAFVKGTLVRKPIYDGRFYTVEITGGKLQVPVADGKMKEELYQSMQLEGYDNPRKEFITTVVNNHIGSDVQYEIGKYDAVAHTFTYYWDSELLPGKKVKNKRILKVVDNDHYVEAFFEEREGKEVKVRELDYERISK